MVNCFNLRILFIHVLYDKQSVFLSHNEVPTWSQLDRQAEFRAKAVKSNRIPNRIILDI